MKLQPTGGMAALLPGADFDSLNIVALSTAVYSADWIDGPDGPVAAPDGPNDLPTGAVFGVLTNLGNYAKVMVIESGYNLKIDWVTYEE